MLPRRSSNGAGWSSLLWLQPVHSGADT